MNKYSSPELDIISIIKGDIITVSGNPDELPDDEWGNPDELPDDEW
jgi:hypothetical protein